MKKIAFALYMILASALTFGAETLTMATEATFPPYEFLRGQEIAGIDVEICRAVAQRLGKKFRAENMDFDSVIPAVISGKADLAAAGITITEDRKKNVDFSVPYVTTGIVVIYKKSDPFKDASQLKGKKIGVQSGTTSDAYVLEQLKQEPERYKTPAEACAALMSGRCAFVIADIDPAKNCVKGEDSLAISDFLSSESYAVAVAKGRPDLLAAVNETIAAVKADGRLEKWVADYTAESDKLKATKESASAAEAKPSWLASAWQSFRDDFYLCFQKPSGDGTPRGMYLVRGLLVTIQVALAAIVLGLLIGFLVAVIRASHDKYGYFPFAEIIRAGITSIDPGQMEAARALGLGYWRAMLKIILPQAVRNVLPALGNEFIVLMKDTSIVGYIALIDLAKGGDIIRSQTYSVYLPYLTVAAIYLVLVMTFTWLLGKLERHLRNTGADVVHNDS